MTDRVAVLPSQIVLNTDILSSNRYAYIGTGRLTDAILGSAPQLNGFVCKQNSPTANLSVNVEQGEIYIEEEVDTDPYPVNTSEGGLPADSSLIVKQGIYPATVNFPFTAPPSPGTSVNYLIQVTFEETDTNIVNRAYYDPTNVQSPIFNAVPTTRQDAAVVTVKAGIPATTGTQVTPIPDPGNVGARVVTVANGQTQIINADITDYPGAPFINEKLGDKISRATADRLYEKRGFYIDSGTPNTYVLTLTSLLPPPDAYYDGMPISFEANSANTGGGSTVNVDGVGAVPFVTLGGSVLPIDIIDIGTYVTGYYKASISSFVLTNSALNHAGAVMRAYLTANQTITSVGPPQKLLFTVLDDTFTIYNALLNRIEPTISGWYKISMSGYTESPGTEIQLLVYKNGVEDSQLTYLNPGTAVPNSTYGSDVFPILAGEYYEIFWNSQNVVADLFANNSVSGLHATYLTVVYQGSL